MVNKEEGRLIIEPIVLDGKTKIAISNVLGVGSTVGERLVKAGQIVLTVCTVVTAVTGAVRKVK